MPEDSVLNGLERVLVTVDPSPGRVGVLGATSLVGACLLPRLVEAGYDVVAFSRRAIRDADPGVECKVLPDALADWSSGHGGRIGQLICAAPIWVLPGYLDWLSRTGARRVVVLSSSSRFTKSCSSDRHERAIAHKITEGEDRFRAWAENHGVEWITLRPTLIYGCGRDKNISEIARFIRRYRFFPLFGHASGLRQPVHANDVAAACVSALRKAHIANRAYCISGGETLSYREMVERVFNALGIRPRLLSVPLWLFGFGVRCLRPFPRYRHLSLAMVERMNRDLVFEHGEAKRDLDFSPRLFSLTDADIPDLH